MKKTEGTNASPLKQSLVQVLAAFHWHLKTWNGIPSTSHLVEALQKIRADYALIAMGDAEWRYKNFLGDIVNGRTPGPHGDNLCLLDVLIVALESRTNDGWKLQLSGPKGPRPTSSDFFQRVEIAATVMTHIEAGGGYDAAVAAAASEFQCKKTRVKSAYTEFKEFVDFILRVDDESPGNALRLYAEAGADPRK